MWLLIGSFQATRKVIIFTDRSEEDFSNHLLVNQHDSLEESRICFKASSDAFDFDLDKALSPWSSFCNKEVVSEFEAGQLNLILKKFVKQIVTRASQSNGTLETFSFEKLLNVTTNLTRTHTSVMQKHARRLNETSESSTVYPFYNVGIKNTPQDEAAGVAYKPIDVNYNFIRSLFLDKVLENPNLY